MQQNLGFGHFFAQADGVGHFLLLALAVMSVATWYLIVSKTWSNWQMRRRTRNFMQHFWEAKDMRDVSSNIRQNGIRDPFSHVTHHGLRAAEQHRDRTGERMVESARLDPQPELHIRADGDLAYKQVVAVMSDAAKVGLTRIGFVTDPRAP